MAALLCAKLSPAGAPSEHIPYPRLIRSVFTLFAESTRAADPCRPRAPDLRSRSPPYHCRGVAAQRAPVLLSTTQIALFGLAGAAGPLARPGRPVVRSGPGAAHYRARLATMLASGYRAPCCRTRCGSGHRGARDRLRTAVGARRQQSLVYRVRPEAQSRLTAGYMVFYSIGSAVGANTSPSSTHAPTGPACAARRRHHLAGTRVLGGDRPPRTRSRTAVNRPSDVFLPERRFAMTHYRTSRLTHLDLLPGSR